MSIEPEKLRKLRDYVRNYMLWVIISSQLGFLVSSHMVIFTKGSANVENADRTSTIGQMINNYLQNETNMDDNVIHLLFSANRWEKA